MSNEQIPNILDVIRTYRKERDLPFDIARALAIKEFEMRGWPVPEYARPLAERVARMQR